MTRAVTWSNPDGLVVGFGPNTPQLTGANTQAGGKGGSKVGLVKFDWKDLNAQSTINFTVPAGSRIQDVRVVVDVGFTSTGVNTCTVGDASVADGFISATAATTTTMATAGNVILADGVYGFATTDATAYESKLYAAATAIVLATGMVDWLGGKGTLVVTYV